MEAWGRIGVGAAVVGWVIVAVACDVDEASWVDTGVRYVYRPPARAGEPLQPLPVSVEADPELVDLGRELFHDPQLSGDGSISCASCHVIAEGGDDGRSRSLGIGGVEGEINAPTVLNSDLDMVQFWDGRAATLEEQAECPVEHPSEMGSDWEDVVRKVGAVSSYADRFVRLFADGVTADNIRKAIAVFERTLITPDSPFDRWLLGDDDALTEQQLAGYVLFKSAGCVTCHQGRNVGGNMYQVFGVMGDYFADRGDIQKADLGRFAVTGDEADRHVFKVPSLRNVALTAPYFHDASANTLEDAVNVMALYQLGRMLDMEQTEQIVAFLGSLTGRIPTAPESP